MEEVLPSQWAKALRKNGLDTALPFAVDAAWQIVADWQTPMPFGYRIGRVAVSAGVGLASGGKLIAKAFMDLKMAGMCFELRCLSGVKRSVL